MRLVILCGGTVIFGRFLFLTVFMQAVWGCSALKTGLGYLPLSAGIMVGSAAPERCWGRCWSSPPASAFGSCRTGSVIEIQALQALALAAAGDENAAVDALAQALMLGCPRGYVRVFADEGPPMAALLGRLVAARKADQPAARGVPLGCLARLLRAVGGKDAVNGSGRGAAPAVPGLAEQLTARELEVLALLAAGTPNPRIAAELVVTLDTVKKHVSHLLGKLGAANRTEAVTRARQLGLIPLPGARSRSPRGTAVPRGRPGGTTVPGAGRRRFHRHPHLRVTPATSAGS